MLESADKKLIVAILNIFEELKENTAMMGFPGSSVVKKKKKSVNAGDSGLIPGLGRSPEEGNDKPLQYSFLGNPIVRGAWRARVHGVTKVRYDLVTKQHHHCGRESQQSNGNNSLKRPKWKLQN